MLRSHPNPHTTILLGICLVSGLNGQEQTNEETTTTRQDASEDALISERETVDVVDDSTVAEAVERRPDLQFRNVTIDGEKATLSLDEIPAEAVSSLEVLRAVTPDLDADSRGGSLSLESNPTFNLEEPVKKGSVKFTYSDVSGLWTREIDASYGKSLGKFGFTLTGKRIDIDDYGENLSNNWGRFTPNGNEFFAPRHLSLQNWDFTADNTSLNLKTDYKLSEVFYLFLRGNTKSRHFSGINPRLVYRLGNGSYSHFDQLTGLSEGARVDRNLTTYTAEGTDDYVQFGGVAKWEHTRFDFQTSYDESYFLDPSYFTMEFEKNDVDLAYDLSDPLFPAIEPVDDTLDDPSQFEFDELSDVLWKQIQTDFISTANFKHDFQFGENKAYLKTGLKHRSRERDQTNEARIYTAFEGELTMDELVSPVTSNLAFKNHYNLAPAPDNKQIREFFMSNQDRFVLHERRTREQSDPGTYDVQEDISAAYVMLNLERGRMRGIVGTRFERTALDFVANEVIIDNEGNYQETLVRTGSSSYQNYFPSAHFRYFLGEKTTLIASWTGTIERPFYSILVPFRNIDYEDQRISEGNPQLKPTLYNNLDLSIDYKLSDKSTLSLELFQKEIEDIVFWEETDITEGEFAGFDFGTYNNGPSADRRGLKLIWDQKLGEWAPLLDGFSFNFNITLLDSETEYPNRPDVVLPITGDHRQQHQLSLTYDKGKTYVQVLWRQESDSLQSVDNDPWRDSYSLGRDNINLSASYKLSESNRLFIDVNNLLSEPYQSYRGTLSRPSRYSLNERRISFGLRMKL